MPEMNQEDAMKFIKEHLPKNLAKGSEHIVPLFENRAYVVGRLATDLVQAAYNQGVRDTEAERGQ
jgi:CBS-domain-containing membrane protein